MNEDVPRVITRDEAMAAGLKRYFTGAPCKRGHISERRVANWNCEECVRETMADWRKSNKTRIHAYNAKQYYKDPTASRERVRKYYEENKEDVLARFSAAHAQNPEKKRARAKDYVRKNYQAVRQRRRKAYARNVDKMRAEARAYAAVNKNKIRDRYIKYKEDPNWRIKRRAWYNSWCARNVEVCRTYRRNRSAMLSAAVGRHTADEIRDIYKLQRGRCAYCRVSIASGYHVDHIKALSRKGSNDRTNLQLTCASCNTSKGAQDPIDFAQKLGRLI